MTIQQELFFRAISSFCQNGEAYFTQADLRQVVCKNVFRKLYKELVAEHIITDCTVNGYAKHCLLTPLDCPNFIFSDEISFVTKCHFLDV